MDQSEFITKVLNKFKIEGCNGNSTPMDQNFQVSENEELNEEVPFRQLIGSLLYVSIVSRPDITFATSYLSQYSHKPTNQLWQAAKKILRYLQSTKELHLIYEASDQKQLIAYTDANWGNDRLDRKSITGSTIYYGKNPILWSTRKQSVVALSTAEAEYIACAHVTCDLMYLQSV